MLSLLKQHQALCQFCIKNIAWTALLLSCWRYSMIFWLSHFVKQRLLLTCFLILCYLFLQNTWLVKRTIWIAIFSCKLWCGAVWSVVWSKLFVGRTCLHKWCLMRRPCLLGSVLNKILMFCVYIIAASSLRCYSNPCVCFFITCLACSSLTSYRITWSLQAEVTTRSYSVLWLLFIANNWLLKLTYERRSILKDRVFSYSIAALVNRYLIGACFVDLCCWGHLLNSFLNLLLIKIVIWQT